MGIFFWILVWIFMISAFTGAWTFIVKGCEALDEANMTDEEKAAAAAEAEASH